MSFLALSNLMLPTVSSWGLAPIQIGSGSDETHLWMAELASPILPICELAGFLSEDEEKRFERFRSDRDRRRFVACRGILRALVGCYLGLDPGAVEFEYGPYGKPGVKQGDGQDLHFSVSHSDDIALYALTWRRGIGVDVEHLRPVPLADKIVESCFTPRERAAYAALSPAKRKEAFFHAWTCKEACLKAIGVGLSVPLQSVEVLFGEEDAAEVRWLEKESEKTAPWIVHAFEPKRNYAAAVAVEGSGCRLRFWEWGAAVAKPPTGAQTAESCSAIHGRWAAPEGGQ
jgi:4'-phosphopantetheinyl transferase